MARTRDSFLSKLLLDLENIMYFPKTMTIGMPFLIFISLFFVPENFIGLTKSSQTMDSDYRNKWLFDAIYISSIVLFINFHIFMLLKKTQLRR